MLTDLIGPFKKAFDRASPNRHHDDDDGSDVEPVPPSVNEA